MLQNASYFVLKVDVFEQNRHYFGTNTLKLVSNTSDLI